MSLLARILYVLFLSSALTGESWADASPGLKLSFSEEATSGFIERLEGGIAQCSALPVVYQFDCVGQAYRATASAMNGKPDYREAQKAISHVDKTLRAVVKQYADPAAPAIRSGGRTYKAIRPASVRSATAAYDKARSEAVTMLLRSDGKAHVHYARIAEVIGSSKVIIRTTIEALRRFA